MARASRWRSGLASRGGVGHRGGWWVAALLALVAVATPRRPAAADWRTAGAARSSLFARRLAQLQPADVQGGLRGVEREQQRVDASGQLSIKTHPRGLGHPLTHSLITTDFAESQLELITKPHPSNRLVLAQLEALHAAVAPHLDAAGELPWAGSMPGPLLGRGRLPLAHLGSSYAGRLKGLYRAGLVARYGDLMQAISGVHFNYSFPMTSRGVDGSVVAADDGGGFWPALARLRGAERADARFISEQYFGVLRNYRRVAWLTTYLFGASPAIDASFLDGAAAPAYLQPGVGPTLLAPFATSLRQSRDLGYGLKGAGGPPRVSVNSPWRYLQGLYRALRTPNPAFATPDSPLTAAQLQLESELYGLVRPKRTPAPGERVLHALEHGVEYLELRNLDCDPFAPTAIDPASIYFLEAMMVASALHESPPLRQREERELAANLQSVACEGRKPGLRLRHDGREVELHGWARALLDELAGVCELLDAGVDAPGSPGGPYSSALAAQRAKLDNPALTPSARVIEALRERSFVDHTLELARAHRAKLLATPLSDELRRELEAEAARSIALERAMREGDRASGLSFEQYVVGVLAKTETPPAPWLRDALRPAPVHARYAGSTTDFAAVQ